MQIDKEAVLTIYDGDRLVGIVHKHPTTHQNVVYNTTEKSFDEIQELLEAQNAKAAE